MGFGNVVRVVSTQTNTETTTSVLTHTVTEYVHLRREEKQLRNRINFLEKKVAHYGPLKLTFSLATLLEEEKRELGKKRQELNLLETQLQKQSDVPSEQKTAIATAQLERLLSDIRAKQEQILIYQDNVGYLEEKQAKLELSTGLDLFNELKLTRMRFAQIQSELAELELEILVKWQIDVRSIKNLLTMSDEEIQVFAAEEIKRRESSLPPRGEEPPREKGGQFWSSSDQYKNKQEDEEIDTYIALLQDRDPNIRADAADKLGEIRNGRATESLIKSLNDEVPKVRMVAAWALGKIGDTQSRDPLKQCLRDCDKQVRREAKAALHKIDEYKNRKWEFEPPSKTNSHRKWWQIWK